MDLTVCKRRKLDSDDTTGSNSQTWNSGSRPLQNKHLMDLNADCLNEIFKYLNSMDIITLADANLTSRTDIAQAFTPNTSARTHPYEATIRDHFLKNLYHDFVYISNDPRHVDGFEKVLQYFGTLVPEILLHYETRHHRRYAKMEQLICHYATSLTEMSLINADMSAFEDINKPFETMKHLKFEGGWLSQKFCELGKWFPNLVSLMLIGAQIANPKCIEMPFPNLRILMLRNKHICRYDRVNRNQLVEDPLDFALSSTNVERFIMQNPQLENLTIYHDDAEAARDTTNRPSECVIQLNSRLLDAIALNLPKLNYLKINIEDIREFDYDTEVIQFRYLKTLIVEAKQINQLHQIMNAMSNRLSHLTITLNRNYEYQVLCQFIIRFKYIDSLLIQHRAIDVKNAHFADLMTKLIDLSSLQITLQKDNIKDSVCFIMEKCNKLYTLTIRCTEIEKEDQAAFIKDIDPLLRIGIKKWTVETDCSDFIFTRCY